MGRIILPMRDRRSSQGVKQVTHLILTHAHFDNVGGSTRCAGRARRSSRTPDSPRNSNASAAAPCRLLAQHQQDPFRFLIYAELAGIETGPHPVA
jgi:glyoxylase-like metal-dependent hydrolase (beta-lactamase superfamily II)